MELLENSPQECVEVPEANFWKILEGIAGGGFLDEILKDFSKGILKFF